MAGQEPIVRASELGEYEYCARSWWLHHVAGWETAYPERLERGTQAHAAHGRTVAASQRWLMVGLLCIGLALLWLLVQ